MVNAKFRLTLLVLLSFLLSGNCLAELGFSLRECGFIGSWINPQEQFAFFYRLPPSLKAISWISTFAEPSRLPIHSSMIGTSRGSTFATKTRGERRRFFALAAADPTADKKEASRLPAYETPQVPFSTRFRCRDWPLDQRVKQAVVERGTLRLVETICRNGCAAVANLHAPWYWRQKVQQLTLMRDSNFLNL